MSRNKSNVLNHG